MSLLPDIYRDYITCLNNQDWDRLSDFVHPEICYNGKMIGLQGYSSMLEQNYRDIPDLHFNPELIIANSTHLACRLDFVCSPIGNFLGLPVKGRKVHFAENVFYKFQMDKIREVWSVIDKAAIELQIS